MFNPRSLASLPTALSKSAILSATIRSITAARFGRRVRDPDGLLDLYAETFDLELAISGDFCAVPPGWIENHRVVLPEEFQPVTEAQIRSRLGRMLHAGGDKEAQAAILAAASYVTSETSDGKKRRRRLVPSIPALARRLERARALNRSYVDALLHGYLGPCIDAIRDEQLGGLKRGEALDLLLLMARLWGLHDLQIIAAKLYQSHYLPTSGLFEKIDAGKQSLQAVMKDPLKMREMAEIASRLLRRKPGPVLAADEADFRRLRGFISGDFGDLALELGQRSGLTEDELKDVEERKFWDYGKIAKTLRHFADAAVNIGDEIATNLTIQWDDGAAVTKSKSNTRELKRLTVSAIRYGMEAETALAYAIIAFLDLSQQLPDLIQHHLSVEPLPLPESVPFEILEGDGRVTFERMFAAYRTVFLRDESCLRAEVKELIPTTTSPNIFANSGARKAARRDFIMGITATVAERLGEAEPLSAVDGVEPGNQTDYGSDSLEKALAILKRDRDSGQTDYIPDLEPAIGWRLINYPPPGVTSRN